MTSYVQFEIVTQLDCLSKVEEEVNADVCMIFTYYFVVVGKKGTTYNDFVNIQLRFPNNFSPSAHQFSIFNTMRFSNRRFFHVDTALWNLLLRTFFKQS